jgi:putative transposase
LKHPSSIRGKPQPGSNSTNEQRANLNVGWVIIIVIGSLEKRLTGAIVERALHAEMAVHLRDEKAAGGGGVGNRRNGRSGKTLQTDQGPLAIDVPRDRLGTFEPLLVKKHQARIPGLDEEILALYARGLSGRDIQGHLEELYGAEISPTLISNVTDAVHDELAAWQSRPLEAIYAVIWLDALIVRVRDQGVVRNKAAYVAIGPTLEGPKEVLRLWLDGAEGVKFWLRVLTELRTRGVQDVLFVRCDGLKGFPRAIESAVPKAVVQTCVVHQVRHSLAFVSYSHRKLVAADLPPIYTADSEATAELALTAFEQKWSARYPTIAPSWRNNWTRLVPFLAFPREIRRMVYTTNQIDRVAEIPAPQGHQGQRTLPERGGGPEAALSGASECGEEVACASPGLEAHVRAAERLLWRPDPDVTPLPEHKQITGPHHHRLCKISSPTLPRKRHPVRRPERPAASPSHTPHITPCKLPACPRPPRSTNP